MAPKRYLDPQNTLHCSKTPAISCHTLKSVPQ